ncbi:MAG: hypothetical protein U5O69_01225 [Candidatus Competibacteraceae bacterium]|nr:hypothetical protein [Candidatus Competibacteraceae bacterium]
MTTLITLLLWLTLLGLAAWRPVRYRSYGAWMAPCGVLAALALSDFWRGVVLAGWNAEGGPRLAGPEAAFLSVWILVLLPIARRRLDLRALAATLWTGLIAAAALGVALDVGDLSLGPLDPESPAGLGLVALTLVSVAILFLAGFALCRLATPDRFPWDYPAWCAGLLIVVQNAHPALARIDFGAGHGFWVMALAFGVGAVLYRYLHRSRHPRV